MVEEPKIISLSIPKSMYDWLETHPEINRSLLFRESVENKQGLIIQHMSPLLFLASIMGIVFSIVLIGIGLTQPFIYNYMGSMLTLLGGFLAVATMAVYYRERLRLKKLKK